MSDPNAKIARAREAELLQQNPLLIALLEELENEQIATWRDAEALTDREEAWQRLRAIVALRTAIGRAIDDGKMASHRLPKGPPR